MNKETTPPRMSKEEITFHISSFLEGGNITENVVYILRVVYSLLEDDLKAYPSNDSNVIGQMFDLRQSLSNCTGVVATTFDTGSRELCFDLHVLLSSFFDYIESLRRQKPPVGQEEGEDKVVKL